MAKRIESRLSKLERRAKPDELVKIVVCWHSESEKPCDCGGPDAIRVGWIDEPDADWPRE